MRQGGVSGQSFMGLQKVVKEGGILFLRSNKELVRSTHVKLNYMHMGLKSSMRPWLYSLPTWSSLLLVGACAHTPKSDELGMTREQIQKLQEKVQDLEIRLAAMNEKINLENAESPIKALPVEVAHVPAAHSKVIPQGHSAAKPSFASNEVVDRFREAKILFDSKRYSDAIIEFSDFIKSDPAHPLAASAQYHLGMGYYRQKEFKLAEEELSRGLIAYPHSGHIPDTLLALAEISDALKKESRSQYFREKLLSQFPNSPQARGITSLLPEPQVIERRSDQKVPEVPTAPILPEGDPS
jgi:TolA-binding protein